ncbi:hypothetical protein N9164_07975 [Draconibacterium sp.]|nr:hypothetical protein [Draconibacterium sp.]
MKFLKESVFLQLNIENKEMEVLKVIALAIALVSIAMLAMAIRILIKKGGKFPNTHVSGNKYLKRNGIYCSQTQDRLEQKKAWGKVNYRKVKFVPDMKAGE